MSLLSVQHEIKVYDRSVVYDFQRDIINPKDITKSEELENSGEVYNKSEYNNSTLISYVNKNSERLTPGFLLGVEVKSKTIRLHILKVERDD